MKPKVPLGTQPGVKIGITCRCGTRLRFAMPTDERRLAIERAVDSAMNATRNPFGDMAAAINLMTGRR